MSNPFKSKYASAPFEDYPTVDRLPPLVVSLNELVPSVETENCFLDILLVMTPALSPGSLFVGMK